MLYTWTDDRDDPRYPYLKKHLEELKTALDEEGEPLTLAPLYLPEGGVYSIGERNDPALSTAAAYRCFCF